MQTVKSEERPKYLTADNDDEVIRRAIEILRARLRTPGTLFSSPQTVKDYLTLNLRRTDHEVFHILYLDSQNRLIEDREEFRGTLTQCSVYPREVVKSALELNAASVILSHNHPSGTPTPSRADEALTQTLKTALALIDVRVLDHVVVGGDKTVSFAESGIL